MPWTCWVDFLKIYHLDGFCYNQVLSLKIVKLHCRIFGQNERKRYNFCFFHEGIWVRTTKRYSKETSKKRHKSRHEETNTVAGFLHSSSQKKGVHLTHISMAQPLNEESQGRDSRQAHSDWTVAIPCSITASGNSQERSREGTMEDAACY